MHKQKQDGQAVAENLSFMVKGIPLEKMREFVYLGKVLSEDSKAVRYIVRRIKKVKRIWGSVSKVLKREGTSVKAMVVQAVFLYGSDL